MMVLQHDGIATCWYCNMMNYYWDFIGVERTSFDALNDSEAEADFEALGPVDSKYAIF